MASCAAENDLILFDHDLNDTVEYEDLSMTMETSNSTNSGNLTCSNKRFRSESGDSDSSEISMKKRWSCSWQKPSWTTFTWHHNFDRNPVGRHHIIISKILVCIWFYIKKYIKPGNKNILKADLCNFLTN